MHQTWRLKKINRLLRFKRRLILKQKSTLGQSSLHKSKFDLKLKSIAWKCVEHDQANTTHLRSLELEDLTQLSYSEVENVAKVLSSFLSDIEVELQILKIPFGYMKNQFRNMQFSTKILLFQSNLDICRKRQSYLQWRFLIK